MSGPDPRFEHLPELGIAGRTIMLDADPASLIPALWRDIGPELEALPARVNTIGYGLCLRPREAGGAPEYMAACEVPTAFLPPASWRLLRLPASRYAVFPHSGPLATLQNTVRVVFDHWLPASGCAPSAGTLVFFERYGTNFDARSSQGDVEIWLPIAN